MAPKMIVESEQIVKEVLLDHFPNEHPAFIEAVATYFLSVCRYINSHQLGQVRHNKMLRNIEALAKIESNLEGAKQGLEKLEPLGKEALSRGMVGLPGLDDFPLGYEDRVDQVIGEIDLILQHTKLTIETIQSAGDWKTQGRGRPREDVARIVALECANIYRGITGKKPTVITHSEKHVASGPFLDFVKDIFSGLNVSGRPEPAARLATEEVKVKKPSTLDI